MSETNQYLIYQIHISDMTLITQLQGSLHPIDGDNTVVGNGIGAILAAPTDAAIKYSAPILAPHADFVAPCITSSWFGTEDQFPTNVATFDRKSGGWFGIPFLFGDTTHYHWRGVFVYAPPLDAPGVPIPPQITTRAFIDGFELPLVGEGGAGSLASFSREASRHVQGFGLALRSQSTAVRNHAYAENGSAASKLAWDRFYVRLRTAPGAATTFWRIRESVQANAGATLDITPSGQIAINWVSGAGALSLLGTTSPLLPEVWYRLDVLTTLTWDATSHNNGISLQLSINGIATLTASQANTGSTSGSSGTDVLMSSEIGTLIANTLGLDVDDWHGCTAFPAVTGIDWINGSAMLPISPTGLDAATTGGGVWVGDYRALLQDPPDNATATLVGTGVGSTLVVNTDALDVISAQAAAIGAVAIAIGLKATGVSASGATLGLSTADASIPAPLTAAVTQQGSNWMTFLWKLAGGTRGSKPTAPVNLVFNHGVAGTVTIKALLAVVELLGTFGPEDTKLLTPPPTSLPTQLGMHNAPYPNTPWARLTTPPIQPVFIRSGTYVGNGTSQDLAFPVPIHLLFVRPLAGDTGGVRWFTSMMAPHHGLERQSLPHHMVQALIDPNFVPAGQDTQQQQTLLRIVGSDTQSNANAVTYAYLAIGDPGMRFLLNGCLKDHKIATDVVTVLKNPGFAALAGFVWQDSAGDATAGGFYKGPGHAPANISPLGAAEIAAALAFGAGSITSSAAITGAFNAICFALMRMDDGSGNSGKVAQIGKYTGDGNASRTIALAPASGKRPLWAMVVPHNANAIYRDVQNTGVNSQQFSGGANTATGIMGGDIDTLSVGITLNGAGIVYDYLVFPGDSTAGNAGFSIAGDFFPVPPDPPPGAPTDDGSIGHAEPPDAPIADPSSGGGDSGDGTPVDPIAPTGPMPGLSDDLDSACVADTLRIVNVALSRLGISQQIVNIATDTVIEAVVTRLEYPDAVQATLRDFPWPFATRYVQLAVVTTNPNSDWAFAYRQPTDCLFERRLVVKRHGAIDPEPPAFQLATDDTGGLIFTNLANAVLEYTARPKCPHTRSEPLFRDAVAWRLAAALAPALTRLTDAAINCTKMYWTTIDQARQVLRPNNPGEAAATATVDLSAAAQAANVSVVNLALVRIGARTIRNLSTDQSREAQTARLIFERELRTVLRDFPWAFATTYVAPALVGGTADTPVNGDWQYSYRLPTDLVFARRLVSAAKRAYDRNPPTFKLAQDGTGGLLFTDVAQTVAPDTPAPVLEYTARLEAAVLVSDALFQDALAWKLASTLAPAVALAMPETPEQIGRGPDDPKTPKDRPATGDQLRARASQAALQMYQLALRKAVIAAANEAQPDLDQGQADWIDSRDGVSRTDRWGWDR